ncbi:N-acetylglucosamine kinase [Subsaximicrobium wynnwilliamsii]|uniref:N-acetylglucosamine kinase n=1 Tax=Subsaximicrobium wynnwilliamsii TaxID=291179 RepID=A0A5C6ZI87_9FLAO|nr:N-acetylglucosamine kinase [Subsaximicrobium wynnwilliamsii]TXD84122.1 N-acetylglucosamine kinase [Subsaximicrobium wynnwilliamsii]TXD88920.1 N-acetylglucosamine kinase [Subsaximicrobium wynnwilliamsii]TXE03834.1 N-acetylglucosamine kinase [Subsaximicrobium wynnwilliamsii]
MVLIVDSGSTKCDWIAVDTSGKQLQEKIRTHGLNPAILTEKQLKKIIKESEELKQIKGEVTHLFFYGAGCGTDKPKATMLQVLQAFFEKAMIDVQEDTMAAVRATLSHDDEAAVVCIMGTGSNCSYYDGNVLHQRVKSLGYSLMDDASGNYFGKELIKDYYYNNMPEDIRVAFEHKYNMEADFIKHNLYKQPNPNAYLANFAEFMFLNKESKYMDGLIKSGFRVFVKNMIFQYKEELKTVPVHFAGSIAFFSKKQILQVADEMGFKVGNFARRPIEGLLKYHTKNLS